VSFEVGRNLVLKRKSECARALQCESTIGLYECNRKVEFEASAI
jgi:hypothetical protein